MVRRHQSDNKNNAPFVVVSLAQNALVALLLFANAVFGLTTVQLQDFRRDGYLYVSRFFDADPAFSHVLLAKEQLMEQQQQKKGSADGSVFSVIETGMVFGNSDQTCATEETKNNTTTIPQAFREIALRSDLVEACAQLLEIDGETETMRLLRDVFLVKPVQTETYCDWHVDDLSFWPQRFESNRTNSRGSDAFVSNGINVWVAMDDMPIARGGSMAVARGSHLAEWRFDAHRAIGQNRIVDTNMTKDDLAEYLTTVAVTNNTCGISKSDPVLREKIEESKVSFDIKKGDVIFTDRELFHRTIATTEEGRRLYLKDNVQTLSRYSLRYVPGSARLPLGFSLEHSIVMNAENSGRALDDVVTSDKDMWYPEVWPHLPKNIDNVLEVMGQTRLAEAKAISVTTTREFSALLKEKK